MTIDSWWETSTSACTCLNSMWFEIQIKYLLFVGSGLSPKDSPASVAAPPETQAGGNEVTPTPSPGVSGSSVLTSTSAGFLLVGLAVASFSSFWADGSVNFLGQKKWCEGNLSCLYQLRLCMNISFSISFKWIEWLETYLKVWFGLFHVMLFLSIFIYLFFKQWKIMRKQEGIRIYSILYLFQE